MMMRKALLEKISETTFELVIVGGGITGAGIFMEAAKKGYRVLLIEKNDFASGTSSRSAKLIHGGLRYLEHGHFGLVWEGLRERHYLLQHYPHVVKPLPFLFPMYKGTFKYRIAMMVYHWFSRDKNLPEYKFISRKKTKQLFPQVNQNGLKGSFMYYDAVTNDARLCNEVIHTTCHQFENANALNYFSFDELSKPNDQPHLVCTDQLSGQKVQLKTRYVFNATGVWVDEVAARLTSNGTAYGAPSKGTHIVLPAEKLPLQTAIVFPSQAKDERQLYALPWENDSIIAGTTDTEYSGNADEVKVEKEEVDYILKGLNNTAPGLDLRREDVIGCYAGLRPLLKEDTISKERSRDYKIWWSDDHIIHILGGKLTSFHAMGEAAVEELGKNYRPENTAVRMKNEQGYPATLPDNYVEEIKAKYEGEAINILKIAAESKENQTFIHHKFKVSVAEMIYFIRQQSCFHLDDLLTRRFSISYVLQGWEDARKIVEKVAVIMQNELHWTEEEKQDYVSRYFQKIEASCGMEQSP